MSNRMTADSAINVLSRRRDDQVVVSTMTIMAPWTAKGANERDLRCVGFMGGSSTLGLGVALARPDTTVWILDGDGSLAMQLGSLLTISNSAPENFVHIVFNNGVYDTSGAQPTLAAKNMSFAELAKAPAILTPIPLIMPRHSIPNSTTSWNRMVRFSSN